MAVPGTDKFLIKPEKSEKFIGLENEGNGARLVPNSTEPGALEAFEFEQLEGDFRKIRIKSRNGYLQAENNKSITSNGQSSGRSEDPTIFSIILCGIFEPNSATLRVITAARPKVKPDPVTSPEVKPEPVTRPEVKPEQEPASPEVKPEQEPASPEVKPEQEPASPEVKANPELVDGSLVRFKSVVEKKYLRPARDRANIVTHRTQAGRWETFKLFRVTKTYFQMLVYKENFNQKKKGYERKFVGVKHQGGRKFVLASSDIPGSQEMFEIERIDDADEDLVRIKSPDGHFLQAANGLVTADFTMNDTSRSDDPSVFSMEIITPEEWDKLLKDSDDNEEEPTFKYTVRAANLGGWLVADGSIKPSLFDGITDDLLNGTEIRIKAVRLDKYLSAQYGGGAKIIYASSSEEAKDYGTFKVWRTNDQGYQFRVPTRQFIGMHQKSESIVANTNSPGDWETFEIIRNNNEPARVQIKANNGKFLQVKRDGVQANYQGPVTWEYSNARIFIIETVNRLQGEFQLTSGLGNLSEQVMSDHWRDFIREEHFREMSRVDINTVKIPVGWWIAEGPSPPWPFVGGSIYTLDNAFDWAERYDLDVIISLQAARGSQNGMQGSATRDGLQEWGSSESIEKTVKVIEFLAARYANRPCFLAIDLLDKPSAPGVTLTSLKKYYIEGYNTVRKYTSTAYVIMSNRLYASSKEIIDFARGLPRVVVNAHYYDFFNGKSNSSLINEINELSAQKGPLIFIGEWTADRQAAAEREKVAISRDEFKELTKEKQKILEKNTFGWAYHMLRDEEENEWTLESMIDSGYTIT